VRAANLKCGDTVDAEIMIGSEHYAGPMTLTSGTEVTLNQSHPLYKHAIPGAPIKIRVKIG
jgi:hypothetical protein